MDKDILTTRLENQIDKAFDTLIEIQELESKEGPARHLSDRHKTMLGFIHQGMLIRQLWDKFEEHNLPTDQKLILVQEIGKSTYEHYKELYGFDSRLIAKT